MEQEVFIDDIETVNRRQITTNDRIVSILNVVFIIALVLAGCRVAILAFLTNLGVLILVANHLSVLAPLLCIAVWARLYSYYRASLITGNIELYSEYSLMKVFSFLASFFCALRILISVIYVSRLEQTTTMVNVYVAVELCLWASLALFFFWFGIDRRKRVKFFESRDESIKL